MDSSFADLRLNRQEGQVNESFWPSFTDIMTTVVMIFVIALVVLLVRNMELVQQLRVTMEAERIAAELAQATGQEKDSLSIALAQVKEKLQQMQIETLRLQDKGVKREKVIANQLATIKDLTQSRDELSEQTAQLLLLRQRLEADIKNQKAQLHTATDALENRQLELAAARNNIDNLQANIQSLQSSLQTAQQQSSRLQEQLADKRKALGAQRQQTQDIEKKYLVLVGEHDNLKGKYNKLIRPARSPKGRHVVKVRYWKEGNDYKIVWRESDIGDYQPIKRKHLDAILTRLNQEKPNGLYVRVIIPENSSLSYNEALEFTHHLHWNYDYYFQERKTAQ